VLEARESKGRPDVGLVTVRTTGFDQDGKVVITFERTVMVYKRGRPSASHATTPRSKRRAGTSTGQDASQVSQHATSAASFVAW
jgi:itaconyl-CoA hydratase